MLYEDKMPLLEKILNCYGRLPYIGNPELAQRGVNHFTELAKIHSDNDPTFVRFAETLLTDERGRILLQTIFGNSPHLTQLLYRQLSFFKRIMEAGIENTFHEMLEETSALAMVAQKPSELMSCLRIAKQKLALLVALADLTESWPLSHVTAALSDFAEVALGSTVNFLLREAAKEGAITLSNQNNPSENSGLIILALGKLGAYELNYSSDIDIVIFYDTDKVQYTGSKNIQQFFVKLASDLVKIMQERTQDSYVFRTDLRLRPDPGSTPIAVSVAGALFYYESMGQNWERAAMIKARPIAGDRAAGEYFLKQLNPYIWRKYLDFAAIQDIHSIKRQIDSKQGNLPENMAGFNVKIGHGGIREIEFFVQTQQLIWGGRIPSLRTKATCDTLFALARAQKITLQTAEELSDIYIFLRNVEHRLQMVADHQTHSLPKEATKLEEIAKFLRYTSAEAFTDDLKQKLARVQSHYSSLFAEAPGLGSEGSLVFTGTENDPETLHTIAHMGFVSANSIAEIIRGWHHGRYRVMRAKQARELLTELTPAILQAMAKTIHPDDAFIQFDKFLSKLPTGVQIFSLFNANPHLLDLIAEIMGSYPYLADNLSRKPILLEYVLYPEFLAPIPPLDVLQVELDALLQRAGNYEDILDISRRWTHDKEFQIGVQFIKHIITLEQVRQCLTNIAEAVLATLFPYVQREFERRRGRIAGGTFAVIALGKFGSSQLTFASDMDLLFVFDAPDIEALSDGKEPLAANPYYTRLSRRFLSAFNAPTTEGKLYDIDLRLRPSGESAPLASSKASFEIYYENSAWTWEYMALTHARPIAGDEVLCKQVAAIIKQKLSRKRDKAVLVKDVLDMREKIAKTHPPSTAWNIKYATGGLVDVEFIAQFLQLFYAWNHPDILDTNTRQVFGNIAKSHIIPAEEAYFLSEASLFLLNIQSAQRLLYWDTTKEVIIAEKLKNVLTKTLNASSFEVLYNYLVDVEKKVEQCFRTLVKEI